MTEDQVRNVFDLNQRYINFITESNKETFCKIQPLVTRFMNIYLVEKEKLP